MNKKWIKYLKGREGFTLIELLIVIAVLAVLSLLIIPRLTISLEEARVTTDETNVKLLQSAVERYYFDKGSFPTASGTSGETAEDLDMETLVEEGYIDEEAEDPWRTGRTYKIQNGLVQKLGVPASP
jgi:type II secretion system protein G